MVWTFVFWLGTWEDQIQERSQAMSENIKRRMRCAVYTRKSTEEGLDQEYNSIDAQRDAGHAYIASQRNEGWIPVSDDYDDPAYSGGNMERPALRRLLADIEAGKIDVVIIYKIDRLTRSLADFSKMVEVFEQRNVSFVSVTQQFNTTTSMGRLMLNILLSFAQFEREVTGERIRDKITASKKKGMWMGGIPPLGYDVENRRLVPNEREAKIIRHIFQRFVEIGSSAMLVKELKLDGVTSKSWTTQDGKVRAGKPIDKSLIYKVLNNRTYLGELRHKEQWYQAEHPPIIERELWDKVHTILATNGRVRGNATRAKVPYLLKGIVFGNDGRALSPWHTTKKNGRRYRYYIPQRDAKEHAGASGLPRLPATELESAVLDQLRATLRSPDLLSEVLPQATKLDPALDEAKVTVAMTRLDAIWEQLFPAEQARIVKLLVEKVIVSPNDLEVRLRANGIERLVLELHPKQAKQQEEALA
jgi:DNA invertase Pin-like site-specific DNA recombinase